MRLADIKEVIKASPAIQIESPLTYLQRKAWNILLANAYNELPTKETHRVNVNELAQKLGFGSRNWEHLKDTLEALVDCKVKWNLLNKDKKEKWGVASLLSEVELDNGICTYAFTPYLRYRLYNPRLYTRLNLQMQDRFSRKYALVLWEVCFDYFDIARKAGETPFIALETFRDLMGLKNHEYPVFSEFNRSIIKPAIEEINVQTGYFVEVEYKKVGRKVAELKFSITQRVKETPIQESVHPDVETLPPVALELIQVGVSHQQARKIAQREWEFVQQEALPPPGTYPDFADYVSEKIELAYEAAGVENLAGFLLEAIRDNYQDPKIQKQRHQRAQHLKEKQLQDLKQEFLAKRKTLLRQAVHADPTLVDQAAERIQLTVIRRRLEENPTPLAAYQKGGLVTAAIHDILAEGACKDILAPLVQTYEDEKARIQQK